MLVLKLRDITSPMGLLASFSQESLDFHGDRPKAAVQSSSPRGPWTSSEVSGSHLLYYLFL